MALSSIERHAAATLLIVDDDRSARDGLRSIFETAGHKTITVRDAPEALRLLREQSCDLVMLDVELPDVDGLALCRLVRAQPKLKQLPDRKSTRLNSSHQIISYAVFCLKKKNIPSTTPSVYTTFIINPH